MIIKGNKELIFFSLFYFLFILFLTLKNSEYINNDGFHYIYQADLIFNENFHSAFSVHKSILYPYLSSSLSKLINADFYNSFKFLNLFFAFITYVFLALIFKDKPKLLLFFTIAFIFNYTYFKNYYHYIIRDHGAWAFLSLSIYLYHRFSSLKSSFYLIPIIIASLFRVEFLFYGLIMFMKKQELLEYIYLKKFLLLLIFFISFYLFLLVVDLDHYLFNEFWIDQINTYGKLITPIIYYFIAFSKIIFPLIIFIPLLKIKELKFDLHILLLITTIFLAIINYYVKGTLSSRYVELTYFLLTIYITFNLNERKL